MNPIGNINQRLQYLRNSKHRSTFDCATVLGITEEQYINIEKGIVTPTLPQFELLSVLFEMQLKNFLLNEPLIGDESLSILDDDIHPRFNELRNKMIHAKIKKAIANKQMTIEDIDQATPIPINLLKEYLEDKKPIPIDDLFIIMQVLDLSLDAILDQKWLPFDRSDEKLREDQWKPEYTLGEVESFQDMDKPDQIIIAAIQEIPKKAQVQIAKIILNNLKSQ